MQISADARQEDASKQYKVPKASSLAPRAHAGVTAPAKHAQLAQQQDSLQQCCPASGPPSALHTVDAAVTLQLCTAGVPADVAATAAAKAQVRH